MQKPNHQTKKVRLMLFLPFDVKVVFTIIPCVPASNRKTIVASPITVIIPVRIKDFKKQKKQKTSAKMMRMFLL